MAKGYDRQIIAGLRTLGWQVDVVNPGEGFPFPTDATMHQAQEMLLAIPRDAVVVIDGLAMGVMPETARRLSRTHDLVALVHHPLALWSWALQRTIGRSCGAGACRSRCGQTRHRHQPGNRAHPFPRIFAVAPERITVVLPGTARAGCAGFHGRHGSTTPSVR